MSLPKINNEEQQIRISIAELKLKLTKTIIEFGEENILGDSFTIINIALNETLNGILHEERRLLINELKEKTNE